MASNAVTPIASIDRVRGARIGERRDTYFTQLEEWRIYSQLLAAERREQEQGVTTNPLPPAAPKPCQ
jgi:hypothetical protein